jgi:MYXO-CTERM domain-containing protein
MLGLAVLGCLSIGTPASAQEDVGSTTAAVCCGSECCNIGGTCRGRGQRNPANMCQQCDPGNSQSSWSNIAGCAATADSGMTGGGGDDGGGCSTTALSAETATPVALGALFGLLGLARRRRR